MALCRRGFDLASRCHLCRAAQETISHLFCVCPYAPTTRFDMAIGYFDSPQDFFLMFVRLC